MTLKVVNAPQRRPEIAMAAGMLAFRRSRAVIVVNRAKLRVEAKRVWEVLWALSGCEAGQIRLSTRDVAAELGVSPRAAHRCIETLVERRLVRVESREEKTGVWTVAVHDPTTETVREALRAVLPDPQGELPLVADDDRESVHGEVGHPAGHASSPCATHTADPDLAALSAGVAARRRELGLSDPPSLRRASSAVCAPKPPRRKTYDLQRDLYSGPSRPFDLQDLQEGLDLPEDQSRGGLCDKTAAGMFDPSAIAERHQVRVDRILKKIGGRIPDRRLSYGFKLKWAQNIAHGLVAEDELNRILNRIGDLSAAGELTEPPRAYFIRSSMERFGELKVPWKYIDPKPQR